VADAFGVAEVDGFADVEEEAIGSDEAGSDFAGVEGDVDFGVDGVEVVEHEHLAVVLGHGHVGVFGLDEVDSDYVGRCGRKFKVEEGLGEDLLGREGAEDLGEEADLDGTAEGGVRLAAVLDLVAGGEGVGEFLAGGFDFVAEAAGEELVAEFGEFGGGGSGGISSIERLASADVIGGRCGGPAEFVTEAGTVAEAGGLHDFEILLVLEGGAGGDFVEPLAGVGFIEAAEAGEGGEELVVTADAGAGDEAAHGEGVDESVVEFLILEDAVGAGAAFTADGLGRDAPGDGVGLEEGVGVEVDAEAIDGGLLEEGFGVDGSGEVHVEVGALRHFGEEGVELEGGFAGGIEGCDGALGAGAAGRLGPCGGGERKQKRKAGVAREGAEHGRPFVGAGCYLR